MFFFFQAEDGIRDYKVTGVQTCALPISSLCAEQFRTLRSHLYRLREKNPIRTLLVTSALPGEEIGRASCREREWKWGGVDAGKKKKEGKRDIYRGLSG